MLPLLPADEVACLAREAGIDARFSPNNILRAMIHSPAPTAGFYHLLHVLAFENKINPRYRELVILRLGWRCGSEYLFGQHMRLARQLSISDFDILGIRDPDNCASYGELDRAVIRFADEIHESATVSPGTWSVLEKHFAPPELVELLLGAGLWRLAAGFLNAARVPLDVGIPRWPEGRAPESPADASTSPEAPAAPGIRES
jgi:4-carboxymuconolactone decarboxylase